MTVKELIESLQAFNPDAYVSMYAQYRIKVDDGKHYTLLNLNMKLTNVQGIPSIKSPEGTPVVGLISIAERVK